MAEALDAACAGPVHVYFDNTAGAISDAVYPRLAVGARVVVCGMASIPSWEPWPIGPRIERHLLVKRARMQGFVIFDHMDRYEAAVSESPNWFAPAGFVIRRTSSRVWKLVPTRSPGSTAARTRASGIIRL